MNQEQQQIIDAFSNSLKDCDAVLDKVPEGGLEWAETEGEWSIREVIHHLTDDYNVYTFII